MKNKKRPIIILTAFTAAALLCICAVLVFYLVDDQHPLKQVLPFLKNDPDAEPSVSGETQYSSKSYDGGFDEDGQSSYVLVGDSRTVAMKEAMKNTGEPDDFIYIAKEGEGLEWFQAYGLPQLEETLSSSPEVPIVFNLGVNDIGNIQEYLSLYHQLMEQYPDTSFYFMSVNPIDEGKFYNLTNQDITAFNQSLETAYPSQYLDCYHYLIDNGFDTVDGLHYTQDTSAVIHQYIVDSVL